MKVLLLAGSAALNLKVLYCLYPIAEVHVAATTADNFTGKSRHTAAFKVMPSLADTSAPDSATEWIEQYCRDQKIDIVVPGDIGTAGFLACVAHRLSVPAYPSSTPELLNRIHDKWSFAEALQKAGLATPRTVLITDVASVDDSIADTIGLPLVVKPLNCESSHGVHLIKTIEALRKHVASGAPYTAPPLIAQTFIPGKDIDLSVLAIDGEIVASAIQYWSDDGTLVFCENEEMDTLGRAIVKLFGYSGAAHFDMRIDERTGKVQVVECNPRFWYTLPAAMWQGLNFVEVGIRAVLEGKLPDNTHTTGTYVLPGTLVRRILQPTQVRSLTSANFRGMLQPLTDPMPHIYSLLGRRR